MRSGRDFQSELHATSKRARGYRGPSKHNVTRRPRFTVTFTEADFWAAQEHAERLGVPLAELVRRAVRSFLPRG